MTKVASRLTGIVHKSSPEDSKKMSTSFQAICRPLGFSWTRENQQLNINDTDVGSRKQCLGLLTLLALLCSGNSSEFHYLDELYGNCPQPLCLLKQRRCRTCRALYSSVHKVCWWFLWFNQLLSETQKTRRKLKETFISYFVFFTLLFVFDPR